MHLMCTFNEIILGANFLKSELNLLAITLVAKSSELLENSEVSLNLSSFIVLPVCTIISHKKSPDIRYLVQFNG